jgi:hypothetical protein
MIGDDWYEHGDWGFLPSPPARMSLQRFEPSVGWLPSPWPVTLCAQFRER